MHTIIHPLKPAPRRRPPGSRRAAVRKPHYDCADQPDALVLSVYVPDVDPSGVEITTRGPDIIVTARKKHFVRINWSSLHLESAQHDYELRLRLGHCFDYAALHAELSSGILQLTLPKKTAALLRVA